MVPGFDGLGRMMPLVGGFHVSYAEHGGTEHAFGVLASFTAPHREPCHVETIQMPAPAPCVRGRLALRELPVLHALWQRLPRRPLVLFVDGPGRMHSEGRGFATAAGEALGVRTVGTMKETAVGRLEYPLGAPDDAVPVRDDEGRFLGYAWRPRPPAHRPLYVSVGHALPPVGALALVRAWTPKGQGVPQPLRFADWTARRLRQQVLVPPLAA